MRGTTHNGRTGSNGVYSAKHNDRNFNVDSAEHIDKDRMGGNWYWQRYHKERNMTFEECEKRYYEEHFKDSLDAKNERYRVSGHKERMKTMDEYRGNRLSCPEETLLQIGRADECIDSNLLKKICTEHINWEMNTFPNVKLLDVALHVDEAGAPHIHERKVWIAHSKDGLVVGQAKALDEMGIKRPHPEKKKDRYNNAKTTYTAMCREHFLKVCKEHGLEIELEPDKASKRGLELTEYKRKQEQEKAELARDQAEIAISEQKQAEWLRKLTETERRIEEGNNKKLRERNKQLEQDNSDLTSQNAHKQAEIDLLNKSIAEARNELEQANTALQQVQDKSEELSERNNQLEQDNSDLTSQNAHKQAEIDLLNKSIAEARNELEQANTALQQVQDKSEELNNVTAQVEQANKQLEQVLDMKARASEIHKIFGDRETVSYNKNMIESTRAIGREAYEYMQSAQASEKRASQRDKELDAREHDISAREREIEPLYRNAAKEYEKAHEYKSHVKEYIMGTAENIVKELQPEQDKLSDKMRKFMQRYNVGDQSLDELFDQQQAEEQATRRKELNHKVGRRLKSRDDWGLEL